MGFIDTGVAWNQGDDPSFIWDPNSEARTPIVSAGVSARAALFGAMVLELYYAVPFQRPEKGGHWGVSFRPGW